MPTPEPVQGLIVVDMQRAFVSGEDMVPESDRVLARTRELLAAARANGAFIAHLQNDGLPGTLDEPHTPGWELYLETGDEPVLRKTVDDGFHETDLQERLAARGVKALAVCGVQSEMCVSATAGTALEQGYRVVLPHDAHATYDVPAAENISEVVPSAMVSRVAEWALGDEVEIVAYARDVNFTAPPVSS